MIFYFNSDGTPLGAIFERVFSGAISAKNVYFISPISVDAVVSVAYSLPDGSSTLKLPMEKVDVDAELNKALEIDGTEYRVWKTTLSPSATALCGEVTVQFFVANGDGTVTSTARSVFTVEEGVTPNELSETATYDEITACIAGINAIIKTIDPSKTFTMDETVLREPHQLVVGKYNIARPNAVFMAGRNLGENSRQTGFWIDDAGYAYVHAPPTQMLQVAPKFYVDSEVSLLRNTLNNSINVKVVEATMKAYTISDLNNKDYYFPNSAEAININIAFSLVVVQGATFNIYLRNGETPSPINVDVTTTAYFKNEITSPANSMVHIKGIYLSGQWFIESDVILAETAQTTTAE